MPHVLVWGIETVPDLAGFAAANGHDGKTEDEIRFLKKTISSHPARGSEVGDVLKHNAEKNIDLVQEFVHKLSEAKDFQGALRAQTEFMQSQFAALGEQTKNLSEACGKSAASVFNYPFKNVA